LDTVPFNLIWRKVMMSKTSVRPVALALLSVVALLLCFWGGAVAADKCAQKCKEIPVGNGVGYNSGTVVKCSYYDDPTCSSCKGTGQTSWCVNPPGGSCGITDKMSNFYADPNSDCTLLCTGLGVDKSISQEATWKTKVTSNSMIEVSTCAGS
jgi:hypothetical protein